MTIRKILPAAATALMLLPSLAMAQEADVTPPNEEIGYIFTTFMFLVAGFLESTRDNSTESSLSLGLLSQVVFALRCSGREVERYESGEDHNQHRQE